MTTKMYEIILPANSPSIFWIKNDKIYHQMDPYHPYPFDEASSKLKWTSKNNLRTERVGKPLLLDKFSVPMYAIDNDIDELKIFALEAVEWKESQISAFSATDNIIIVHRTINDSTRLIGYFVSPSITDYPIHWLD